MKECLDEGTLQSYFDGELKGETATAVASHLSSCSTCAQSARMVESENLLLSEALETEFAASVPTEHLRQRVEAAIAAQPIARPTQPGWLESLGRLFSPSPQRAFAYAGLAAVILLITVFGVAYLWRSDVDRVAGNATAPPVIPATPNTTKPARADVPGTNRTTKPEGPIQLPRQVAARKAPRQESSTPALLPGERNYVKTIAALSANIESAAPMRPGLRVEYEHNVALLDSAIEMTRDAVRRNPKDHEAAQFMFAAYQSKVELLNQVADARRFDLQR